MHAWKTTWTLYQSSTSLRSCLFLFCQSCGRFCMNWGLIWEQTSLGKHDHFDGFQSSGIILPNELALLWTGGGNCLMVQCRAWGFSLMILISRNHIFYLHTYLACNFKFAGSFSHCTLFRFLLLLTRNLSENISSNRTPSWMLHHFEISPAKVYTLGLHYILIHLSHKVLEYERTYPRPLPKYIMNVYGPSSQGLW